jgi:hypothetical protein
MYVIRIPSEGGRSADYERGSRHSKKQISHGAFLSFATHWCAAKSARLSRYRKNDFAC